jgi:hypothetical protein
VYYDKDMEKEKKRRNWRGKRKRINHRKIWLQCSGRFPWSRVQTQGHVFNVDRQTIVRGSAPRGSYLQDPAPFAREITERHTVLSSQENRGQSLLPNDGSWAPSRLLAAASPPE